MNVGHFTEANVYLSFAFPYVVRDSKSPADAAVRILFYDIIGAGELLKSVRDCQAEGWVPEGEDWLTEQLRDDADIIDTHFRECLKVLRPRLPAARALWPVSQTVRAADREYPSALDALLGTAEAAWACLSGARLALEDHPPTPFDELPIALRPSLPGEEDMRRLLALAQKEVAHIRGPTLPKLESAIPKEAPPRPVCRLAVTEGGLRLDGEPVPLEATAEGQPAVLAIVRDLISHLGLWRSGSEIAREAPEGVIIDERRIGRHLKALPENVRSLIEAAPGKGQRLTDVAWHNPDASGASSV